MHVALVCDCEQAGAKPKWTGQRNCVEVGLNKKSNSKHILCEAKSPLITTVVAIIDHLWTAVIKRCNPRVSCVRWVQVHPNFMVCGSPRLPCVSADIWTQASHTFSASGLYTAALYITQSKPPWGLPRDSKCLPPSIPGPCRLLYRPCEGSWKRWPGWVSVRAAISRLFSHSIHCPLWACHTHLLHFCPLLSSPPGPSSPLFLLPHSLAFRVFPGRHPYSEVLTPSDVQQIFPPKGRHVPSEGCVGFIFHHPLLFTFQVCLISGNTPSSH